MENQRARVRKRETGTVHSGKEEDWLWMWRVTYGIPISELESPTALAMEAVEHGISLHMNVQLLRDYLLSEYKQVALGWLGLGTHGVLALSLGV